MSDYKEARTKPRKKIPAFKDEDAEREFWAKADSTEYIDWSQAHRISLPNLRATRKNENVERASDSRKHLK
jgi:hypothetical protein